MTRRPGLGAGVWGAWAPWQPGERGGLVSLGSAGVGSEEAASQEVTPPHQLSFTSVLSRLTSSQPLNSCSCTQTYMHMH